MAVLVGIPVLALSVILQSTVFSRVTLINGSVDLVMLVVASWALHDTSEDEWVWAVMAGALFGFVTALPFWVPVVAFLLVTLMAVYLKRRVWQIPVLALFITVVTGTLILHLLTALVLTILQTPFTFGEAFNRIILPSLLLNLLAAIPVNGLISEISNWVSPDDLEA